MNSTPVSLLQRLRQSPEKQSWTRFVQLYTPMLHRWALRAGLQEADASDLVQDVLVVLVQKLSVFKHDGQRSFRAWLYTVTMNQLRNRRKSRAHQVVGDTNISIDEVADSDSFAFLEETEYRQQLIRRAMQIMQADFQPHTWKAFWEHAALGRPAADVAREMGTTAGAVFSARIRILTRLRQELEGLLE